MAAQRRARPAAGAAIAALAAHAAGAAHAQGPAAGPSAADLVVLFSAAGAAVAAIALYISRDAIMRRRTDYDDGSFRSQEDRDYEKYHSDWGSEPGGGRGGARGGPAPGAPDHYATLGVGRGAGAGEIKESYRRLAREAHPDRAGGGDGSRMAEINAAYEVLSDPRRRAEYDRRLAGA